MFTTLLLCILWVDLPGLLPGGPSDMSTDTKSSFHRGPEHRLKESLGCGRAPGRLLSRLQKWSWPLERTHSHWPGILSDVQKVQVFSDSGDGLQTARHRPSRCPEVWAFVAHPPALRSPNSHVFVFKTLPFFFSDFYLKGKTNIRWT